LALQRDGKHRLVLGNEITYLSSQDNGDIRFLHNLHQPGEIETMRITNAGNVGIGTTKPTGRLHIASDSGAGRVTGHGVVIDSGDMRDNPRIELRDIDGTGLHPYIDFSDDATSDFDARIILRDNILRIGHNNIIPEQDITVDLTTGNVGIGTTSPSHKLEISGLGGWWKETLKLFV
jgi:hypothetical protein